MDYRSAMIIALKRALRKNLMIYGGYAAYASILSLFPFVIFLVALASVMGSPKLAEQAIQSAFNNLPDQVVEAIAPAIRAVMEGENHAILTFAALGTVWVASSGIEGIRFGLNIAYEVAEPRQLWQRRLQGIFFTVFGSMVLLFIATGLILWPVVLEWAVSYAPLLASAPMALLRYVMAFCVLTGTMCLIYYYLPNVQKTWRQVLPGAVLATLIWLGLATGFSYYVSNFGDYTVRYGSLAGIILTMLFLHFSSAAILLGGQFNFSLAQLQARHEEELE